MNAEWQGGDANDEALAADLQMYLVAGHDTTGFTLSWILADLAAHPDEQQRLHDDLVRARAMGEDPLKTVPRLHRCINESMRLWPVAAQGSVREPANDVPVDPTDPDGAIIPKGSVCLLQFYSCFRPTWLNEPDAWRPNRWLDEDPLVERLKAEVFPFSLGRRNCIGQAHAQYQVDAAIAHLIEHWKWAEHRAPTPLYFLTLKPSDCRLSAERR